MQIYFCIIQLTLSTPRHIIACENHYIMKKNIYLASAVLGFFAAICFVVKFYIEGGSDIFPALAEISSTTMGQLLAADFTISVIVAWIYIYNESKRLNMKFWWLYILLTCGVGFCFAFPLFLYYREKRLEA